MLVDGPWTVNWLKCRLTNVVSSVVKLFCYVIDLRFGPSKKLQLLSTMRNTCKGTYGIAMQSDPIDLIRDSLRTKVELGDYETTYVSKVQIKLPLYI